jgi:hypothetical protein
VISGIAWSQQLAPGYPKHEKFRRGYADEFIRTAWDLAGRQNRLPQGGLEPFEIAIILGEGWAIDFVARSLIVRGLSLAGLTFSAITGNR